MRLSEAIRLGSLAIQKPKSCDSRYCAIGMGLSAVGKLSRIENENYKLLEREWPWLLVGKNDQWDYSIELTDLFDGRVMKGKMTLDQLCDQVSVWERELAAKGINVEQVTMIATHETTHEPVIEHSKVGVL